MITFRRQQYGASMTVFEDMFHEAAFDIRAYVHSSLERKLKDLGAESLDGIEEHPFVEMWEHPQRWWERLLRLKPREYEVRGVRFAAFGYGWVPADTQAKDEAIFLEEVREQARRDWG